MWRVKLRRDQVKDAFYGSMLELLKNNHSYRMSHVGRDYSSLTKTGEEAVVELVNDMAWRMLKSEEADLNERAKKLVFDELKKRHE
jgi:hypothetical protein